MLVAPRPLTADDQLDGFDCGKPSLNDWLVRHARQAQAGGSARTFAVIYAAKSGKQVVGLDLNEVNPGQLDFRGSDEDSWDAIVGARADIDEALVVDGDVAGTPALETVVLFRLRRGPGG